MLLNELNYSIVHRERLSDTLNEWGVSPRAMGERFAPLQEHLQKITTAYKILAYPHCKDEGLREAIESDLELHRQLYGEDQVELNDAERTILSKLTAARNLPFNPEK